MYCDIECARSWPALPEGKERYIIRPGDLATATRELVDPMDLVEWQAMVWKNEWENLGLEKPIQLQYRLQAASWLTERGFGKTPAFAPVEGEDPMGVTDADREIAALEDELARLREKKLREQAEGSDLAGAGEARADTA